MSKASEIFGRDKALVGMVHVRALPGTPLAEHTVDELARIAADEARTLHEAGFDSIMIENMHDRPYLWGAHGPEITAAMTRVGLAVRAVTDKPIGVQVLAGGQTEALAVALAIGAGYIRVENFVFAEVADEGLIAQATAGELLRYRRAIGADHIKVICDLQKKHAAHAITGDLSLADWAHGAEFFGADGVIVTGPATGAPTDRADLEAVRAATSLPLVVGSGVTSDTAASLLGIADAVIVGSALKQGGAWGEPLDSSHCAKMVEAVRSAHP